MRGVARQSGTIWQPEENLEHKERKPPKVPCGTPKTILAKFPYQVPNNCERWECDKCRPGKIKHYQELLHNSALAATVYTSQLDPIKTQKEKYKFKNFLTRKIVGEYWWFRSNLRTILITRCDNPSSSRRSTDYVIDKLLPEVLNEPFDWWLKDRFGKSRYDNEKRNNGNMIKPEDKKKTSDNPVYAKRVIDGNQEKDDAVFYECRSFRGDDLMWCKWLKDHLNDPEITICEEGYALIERIETACCGDEASAAGI